MAKYLPALIDIRNKQTDEDGDSNEIRVRTEGKLYYLENRLKGKNKTENRDGRR